jgi:hypothetical protein
MYEMHFRVQSTRDNRLSNSFFVFTKSISKTLFKFVTATLSLAESISPAGGGKGVEKNPPNLCLIQSEP